MGCRLWGRTESDTTEATWQQQHVPLERMELIKETGVEFSEEIFEAMFLTLRRC